MYSCRTKQVGNHGSHVSSRWGPFYSHSTWEKERCAAASTAALTQDESKMSDLQDRYQWIPWTKDFRVTEALNHLSQILYPKMSHWSCSILLGLPHVYSCWSAWDSIPQSLSVCLSVFHFFDSPSVALSQRLESVWENSVSTPSPMGRQWQQHPLQRRAG